MSQHDHEERVIDGVRYAVYMLPPRTALDMLVDIGEVVGPALGSLLDGREDSKASLPDLDANGSLFGQAAAELCQHLDKAVLRAVIDRLAEVTLADDVKLSQIFEVHFKGRLGALLTWLSFGLRVQYEDFFDALVELGTTLDPPSTSKEQLATVGSTG